jgi:hypothetical protein
MLMFKPRSWVILGCLLSTAAGAVPTNRPKIALHPLKVGNGSPGEQRDLRLFFKVTVSALEEIEVPLETEVLQALEKNGYASCDRDDECLRRVAVATGSVYAVYAAVGLDGLGDNVVAAARIMRSDAVPMGKGVTLTKPVAAGRKFSEVAREALTQLVAELKLADLPAALPAVRAPMADAPVVAPAAAPVGAAGPPPPPPPLVTGERPMNKWRWASYGAGGVAVVMAVAGATVLGVANGELEQVKAPASGIFASDEAYKKALAVQSRQRTGVGLMVGAGVVAAAAAGCFWYSLEKDAPIASAVIDGRNAMVVISVPLK